MYRLIRFLFSISFHTLNLRVKATGNHIFKKAAISLYYLIFLIVLFGLFVLFLYIVMVVNDVKPPSKRFDTTLIGPPGLSFQPLLHKTSPLIWLSAKKNCPREYVDKISLFLKPYIDSVSCIEGKFCKFNITERLGPCADPPYGYGTVENTLCVYLKINKVWSWTPDCYNNTQELPPDMPEELRQRIRHYSPEKELSYIWVFCQGYHPVDREKIEAIEYYPRPGFDSDYFPLTPKRPGPLIALRFLGVHREILITIRCVAYAKNIPRNRQPLMFQFYVE